jgi:hypothetical protein
VAIGGYSINNYWWISVDILLVDIILVLIGGYSINSYWWIFMIIIGYYINNYWWIFY